MINHFQAVSGLSYPTVPATWPNREIRRAVRNSRPLPTDWVAFFFKFPKLKTFIKTGKMPA
jgi:hypothetical protein